MQKQAPRAYLLCGPIGSGKSTAGMMLGARGALVIDADKVGHLVIGPGGVAAAAVMGRWPAAAVGGRVQRDSLAAIVFSDPAELRALEAITHPAIGAEIASMASDAAGRVVIVEVPLLKDVVGAGWPRVVVDAPDEVRTERLLARGHDLADIRRRMATQPPRVEWLAAADHVLDNSSTLDALADAVERLWTNLQIPGFLVTPSE